MMLTARTADTITDAQIRALRRSKEWSPLWLREFALALGEVHAVNDPAGDRHIARSRCTVIYKARDMEIA